MKRIALSAIALALTGVAHAQSSVTLYGVIDEAIQFTDNVNVNGANKRQVSTYAGNLSGNRWGMKGVEDLGGGLKAIFQVESGFNVNNGSLGEGGRLFGRQAFVGLQDSRFGTLTLGRQYDPVVDMVQPFTGDYIFGSTFTTPGDLDNNDNSSWTDNAVKYVSPVIGGLQVEGMYALGGVAGSPGSGQTWSVAATYGVGSFNVAAGYLRADNASTLAGRGYSADTPQGWGSGVTSDAMFGDGSPVSAGFASAKSYGIASVAGQYVTGPVTLGLRYSNVQFKPDGLSLFASAQRFNIGAAYVGYQVTPVVMLGVGYTYTHGSGVVGNTYHQASLGADYSLSKRTDLYLIGAYQHASGQQLNPDGSVSNAVASAADYGYAAAGRNQTVVSLGLRHQF